MKDTEVVLTYKIGNVRASIHVRECDADKMAHGLMRDGAIDVRVLRVIEPPKTIWQKQVKKG